MKLTSMVLLAFLLFGAVACGPRATRKEGSKSSQPSAAESDTRAAWNRTTLADAYRKHGRKNGRWDKRAIEALDAFGEQRAKRSITNISYRVESAARAAVQAGCDDPMIRYLYLRYAVSDAQNADAKAAEEYDEVAMAMQSSEYPAIRKFYATLRAAEASKHAFGNEKWDRTAELRRSAIQYLPEALNDTSMPLDEVFEACRDLLDAMRRNPQNFPDAYAAIEQPLSAHWSKTAVPSIMKGKFYIGQAWEARGGGYSSEVKPEQWKGFEEGLATAAEALETAWKMDPTWEETAQLMIDVERGQGKGRERMEQWFNRAMALNTNSYEACQKKLFYLEPKWHGSAREMIAFGRECVTSTKWGGRVPLVLLDAHESVASYWEKDSRPAYWKHPKVWADVQSAFEKFFELNPEAYGWRHNYAKYAYNAEQWNVFEEQLSQFKGTNYSYFGGEEEFHRMVERTKARGK